MTNLIVKRIALGKILYARERVSDRERERRKWQNRSALICLHSRGSGSLLKEENTRIIKDGAFTVDLEWEFIRHNLVLVNRKDFQKIISISNLLIVVDAG